jgi:hypothetical protein
MQGIFARSLSLPLLMEYWWRKIAHIIGLSWMHLWLNNSFHFFAILDCHCINRSESSQLSHREQNVQQQQHTVRDLWGSVCLPMHRTYTIYLFILVPKPLQIRSDLASHKRRGHEEISQVQHEC